jgi:FkbM family methyltransferase
MKLVELLRKWPRAFDIARTASRACGRRDSLYCCLRDLLPRLGLQWTFLQAGAHDGLRNDPFREFVVGSSGATGVMVEPWPSYFKQLRKNYQAQAGRLHFLSCAITYPPTEVEFHSFTEEFVRANDLDPIVLSTAGMDRSHLHKQVKHDLLNSSAITTMRVPGLRVEDIMRLSGLDRIDALFFDLEGQEPTVLQNMDFAVVRPRLVVYESKHLGSDADAVRQKLEGLGFTLIPCDVDIVAFREKDTW